MAMTSGSSAEINVTPLIDVLLVLLIIFMVITPTLPHGLETFMPKPNPGPTTTTQPLVLEVFGGAVPQYRLNGTVSPLSEVRSKLQTAFANRAASDRVLFLRADRALPYSQVAMAAGLGRESGAEAIALTTQAQSEHK